MTDVYKKEIELGGKTVSFEFGQLANLANGSVVVTCEETIILVTATASEKPREGIDFFPLRIDVEEKMYAAGKIPGGFFKREGRPSEKSILTARLIDRPLRPSFPEGFFNDVQIIVSPLSVDQINPPDIYSLNGASFALSISDIPFNGPVAAVRIGKIDEKFIINPTFQEAEKSDLDLIVAKNRDGILMIESASNEIEEKEILRAIEFADEPLNKLINLQEEIIDVIGKPKMEFTPKEIDPQLKERVFQLAKSKIEEAIKIVDKSERNSRMDKIEEEVIENIEQQIMEQSGRVLDDNNKILGTVFSLSSEKVKEVKDILKDIRKTAMRKMILEDKIRTDGRKPDEIRPLSIEAGVLPRTHGSALFTRGQTQVLTVCTLGTVGEEQVLDGLGVEESKRYLHHYNFLPFSTGEVQPLRSPNRREIGHGALAERALLPVIPGENEFPYTIRLVSEVLESNGSTSMASVCGSSLSLMDAGVPISDQVAGIAMGLISEDNNYEILTDILGTEDFLGDMDFKVAGTNKGITALQLDNKVGGLKIEILKDALEQARKARLFILDKMNSEIEEPRKELSKYAPRTLTLQIDTSKIRDVIGPGGKTIHSIIEETGVDIDIQQDGTVYISSQDKLSAEKAKEIINNITREVKKGEKFVGTVTRITSFGAFVEVLPGKEGLVHISKLAPRRIDKVQDVVNVGDKILVEVIEIDSLGRINLATADYMEAAEKKRGGRNKGK